MILKVPSNLNHSMILSFCESVFMEYPTQSKDAEPAQSQWASPVPSHTIPLAGIGYESKGRKVICKGPLKKKQK